MVEFSITDNQTNRTQWYSLPTSWDDVTWKQYEAYTLLNQLEFDSPYDKIVQQLAILTHMQPQDITEMGYQSVIELIKHCEFLKEAPQQQPAAHVTIGKDTYYAQKLETFGEVVAHNKVMSSEGLTFEQKLPYILAISLRKRVNNQVNNPESTWFKRLFDLKRASPTADKQVEAFENDADWVENRATLFKNALSVAQIQSFAAFFLNSTDAMQAAFQSFSKLHPLILNQATSLERVSAAITAGNWQSGSFAPLLLKSIGFYFFLLRKYFNVSNTSSYWQTNKSFRIGTAGIKKQLLKETTNNK